MRRQTLLSNQTWCGKTILTVFFDYFTSFCMVLLFALSLVSSWWRFEHASAHLHLELLVLQLSMLLTRKLCGNLCLVFGNADRSELLDTGGAYKQLTGSNAHCSSLCHWCINSAWSRTRLKRYLADLTVPVAV